jgi:UDP-N-acetylmuramoyl-tripeptide--D-alanyl-D-alanine ligase
VVTTPEQAASTVAPWLQAGDALLLKASRGIGLERSLPVLEQALRHTPS